MCTGEDSGIREVSLSSSVKTKEAVEHQEIIFGDLLRGVYDFSKPFLQECTSVPSYRVILVCIPKPESRLDEDADGICTPFATAVFGIVPQIRMIVIVIALRHCPLSTHPTTKNLLPANKFLLLTSQKECLVKGRWSGRKTTYE